MAHIINIPLPTLEYIAAAKNEIYKWGEVNKDNDNFMKIYHIQVDALGNLLDNSLLANYCNEKIQSVIEVVSEYLTRIEDYTEEYNGRGYPAKRLVLTLPQGWNENTLSALRNNVRECVVQGIVAYWLGNIGLDSKLFEARSLSELRMASNNIYTKNSAL